jgi:hypothetical protein
MNIAWPDVVQYGMPALAVIASGWFAYRGQRKAHEISIAAADAAKDNAAAEMRKAVAAEREQASVDWARYCDAQQKDNDRLREQISDNATRIEQVELRSEADREARNIAEKNFRIALVYLRRVIRWIDENLPGGNYPPPPTELNLEL